MIPFGENHVTLLDQVRNIGSTKDFLTLLFDNEIFELLVQEIKIYIDRNLEKGSTKRSTYFKV